MREFELYGNECGKLWRKSLFPVTQKCERDINEKLNGNSKLRGVLSTVGSF